jgi:hypothetical protein
MSSRSTNEKEPSAPAVVVAINVPSSVDTRLRYVTVV